MKTIQQDAPLPLVYKLRQTYIDKLATHTRAVEG